MSHLGKALIKKVKTVFSTTNYFRERLEMNFDACLGILFF